ncbi:MAG: hypothetical protein ACIAQZ_14870 [Sedimentisphaeraceae bacterium JB056]
MRVGNKKIALILVVLACVLIMSDLYLGFSRGFGFYGGTNNFFMSPSERNFRNLYEISDMIFKIADDEYYPQPDKLVEHGNFKILKQYEGSDIWKMEYSGANHNMIFLYSPVFID